jgi:hypothetical protein
MRLIAPDPLSTATPEMLLIAKAIGCRIPLPPRPWTPDDLRFAGARGPAGGRRQASQPAERGSWDPVGSLARMWMSTPLRVRVSSRNVAPARSPPRDPRTTNSSVTRLSRA